MSFFTPPSQLIKCTDLASCFQGLYNFGFTILLAVCLLIFVYGAFEYMLSSAGIFDKEKGKKKMFNAIIVPIIVLIIPVILNLINPYIFQAKLQIPVIKVKVPEIYYAEGTHANPTNISQAGYVPASLNPVLKSVLDKELGCVDVLDKLEYATCTPGYIESIIVKRKSRYAILCSSKTKRFLAYVRINVGRPGSETPLGTFDIRFKTFNRDGYWSNIDGSYMGKILLYFKEGGYLVHAGYDEKGILYETLGCIRMFEADLGAMYPYINTPISDNAFGAGINKPQNQKPFPNKPNTQIIITDDPTKYCPNDYGMF